MISKLMQIFSKNNIIDSDLVSYKTVKPNSSSSYGDLADIGYKKNVIVYRAINLISSAVSSVTWRLKKVQPGIKVDDIIYKHEILDLLEKPNALQSKVSFFESAISHLLLSGNCYILVLKADNKPKELFLLRPDRVKIIAGPNSLPLGYEYQVAGQKSFYPVSKETGDSDVLHIKLFNPLDDWYGMSPVEVALGAIQQHNAIAAQNTAFLQNGGRPSGALMYKQMIDPQKRQELKKDIKALYEGGRNAGKILLLEGDFQWKEMGLSPKDLDFTSGKEASAKEIALAFGIPSILIGIMQSATFSNYKEARFDFWEETVIPLLNTLSCSMSNWFKCLFDTDLQLEYDLDAISALSDRRFAKWKYVNDMEFLSQGEKREAVGYSDMPSVSHDLNSREK